MNEKIQKEMEMVLTISLPLVSRLNFNSNPYIGKNQSRTPSAKIDFKKIILTKDQDAPEGLRGAIAITRDDHHKGWLHKIIYLGQLLNSFFTGKKRDNINLCHAEVILKLNPEKKGELILAHGLLSGIKTTSDNHKTDKVITAIDIYMPVDQKIQSLFARFAEQTAANLKQIEKACDGDKELFRSRVKKELPSFSKKSLIAGLFHKQIIKPLPFQQKQAAFAAADLLRGDKFRDQQGNLASYYCTAYMMTLMQGTSLISAMTDFEKEELKTQSREEIANYVLSKIQKESPDNQIAATYWDNPFMQLDANHTMTYFAGDVLDEATLFSQRVSDFNPKVA